MRVCTSHSVSDCLSFPEFNPYLFIFFFFFLPLHLWLPYLSVAFLNPPLPPPPLSLFRFVSMYPTLLLSISHPILSPLSRPTRICPTPAALSVSPPSFFSLSVYLPSLFLTHSPSLSVLVSHFHSFSFSVSSLPSFYLSVSSSKLSIDLCLSLPSQKHTFHYYFLLSPSFFSPLSLFSLPHPLSVPLLFILTPLSPSILFSSLSHTHTHSLFLFSSFFSISLCVKSLTFSLLFVCLSVSLYLFLSHDLALSTCLCLYLSVCLSLLTQADRQKDIYTDTGPHK